MAEIFGAIMRGLGAALAWIYAAVESLPIALPIAIILLTFAVRALLLPLTIKSTRSMAAMQKAQPEIKKVQAKYRELQKKAKDRMELQQIRLEMNREMTEVMRAHGASPAGGCLPMIAQFPVLIAMFSVMRASIPIIAFVAASTAAGAAATADAGPEIFGDRNLKDIICRPVEPPRATGDAPEEISCPGPDGEQTFRITRFEDAREGADVGTPSWISYCQPERHDAILHFHCFSAAGTGHLPKDTALFSDLTADRVSIFGMKPGCTAQQVQSPERVAQCTASRTHGGMAQAIPYYLLIALIVATSYYSSRQLTQRTLRQGGQIAPQQQMMTRVMPVVFGLISLSLPAGTNLYFLAQNVWQIGQQHIQFRQKPDENGQRAAPEKPKEKQQAKDEPRAEKPRPTPPARPQGSKKKKKKRKR